MDGKTDAHSAAHLTMMMMSAATLACNSIRAVETD